MTVSLLKRMRCHRGRVMHVVRLVPSPWPADPAPWYATACWDTSMAALGSRPYPRIRQPARVWSCRRRLTRRHRGRVVVTVFHDCQECTLEVTT